MEEQKRNPAQGLSESEQVQVRRQKLADLQAAGNDPFTLTKFPQDAYSADLKEEFKDLPNETDSGKKVALAGRLMSKRVMGKASFAHLRDDKGDIQLYVRRDELGDDAYAAFKKLDVGDIIGVKGEVFRTKTGELSARAEEITLLAKSLRPLPEKFHGLTDTEMRYRQRYVDLIANPEVKEYGYGIMMAQYITMGLILGVVTLLDDGIEVAMGIHAANNIFASVLLTFKGSVLPTAALFMAKETDPVTDFVSVVVVGVVAVVILARIYKWRFGVMNERIELPNFDKQQSE